MANPVAPNTNNTLAVPVRRLPLGIAVTSGDGPTQWKVWIPTMIGGILKISHTGSAEIDIQQPSGTSITTGTGTASTYVKFGECFVVLTGASGMLTASLVQTAWARMSETDPAADALLPWNFYYWPSNKSSAAAVEARGILKRYASAVGKSATAADDFEVNKHQFDGAAGWAGHCHNAAPASALFAQPVAQSINGQAFTEEELEFLATEWFGSFGMFKPDGWGLRNTKFPNRPGRWDILGYLKPGGPKDRSTLISAFGHEFDSANAVALGDGWVNAAGSESAFIDWMKKDFGKNAATFFHALQTRLAMAGAPLSSNLRSYGASSGPEQVWNQIVFYYQATFAETWPQNPQDDKDLKVTCDVYSNIDQRPSPNAGGTYSSGVVTPGASSRDSWLYRNVWRIVFDGQGQVNASDDRNEWVSLQNDTGDELYAPTNLSELQAPLSSPRTTGDPFMLGNPVVGAELLTYLKLNARYM